MEIIFKNTNRIRMWDFGLFKQPYTEGFLKFKTKSEFRNNTRYSNRAQSLNPNSEMTLPAYTKSQLALRNGQDKPEIWIAYLGIIYDVTESRLWNNGKHYEHWAGQDLTDELKDAPHTVSVFEKFKVIGVLGER